MAHPSNSITSLLYPVTVKKGENVHIKNTNKSNILQTFHIDFVSTIIDLFYDERYRIFALKSTFHESSSSFSPTDKTKWFASVIECLESVKNTPFSKNYATLDSVHKQIVDIQSIKNYMEDSYADD